MINYIPVVGWIVDLLLKIFLAVPFWFIWNVLGFGAKFFYFLPAVFVGAGFWQIVGLFIIVGIVSSLMPVVRISK